MTEFLRTLWSAITCEFCGTKHNLGRCPRCGASRTVGEHQFVESPHIEKIRAMKQVILRYKLKEELRMQHFIKKPTGNILSDLPTHEFNQEDVRLSHEQTRILEYIMRIVNELTGQNLKVALSSFQDSEEYVVYFHTLCKRCTTMMLYILDKMLQHLESALDVEETLSDIVTQQNGNTEAGQGLKCKHEWSGNLLTKNYCIKCGVDRPENGGE